MHRLGFALIPNHTTPLFAVADTVASTHPCSFVMRAGETVPHVSLFQGVYADLTRVQEVFAQLTPHPLPRELTTCGLSIWAEKIVFLDLTPHPDLQVLHEQIFATFFPLAAGTSADPQAFAGITAGQAASFRETGYPFSRTEYLPHFTIAHLDRADGGIVPSLNNIECPDTVTVAELVYFRVGDKGVVTEILGRKTLSDRK